MRRFAQFATVCTILKKRENTHGGVLLLVKLQIYGVLKFFELYKWYQIVQNIAYFVNWVSES